jgi:predicted nuclease with RNAse H fold
MHQKEERSVIRSLSSEGVKLIEIHRQMKVKNGDACLSL